MPHRPFVSVRRLPLDHCLDQGAHHCNRSIVPPILPQLVAGFLRPSTHTTLYTGNGALGAEVTSVTGFPRPRYPLPRGPTSVWPVATSPWRDWVICASAAFLPCGLHPLGAPPVATLGRAVQTPSWGPLGTLNNSAHRLHQTGGLRLRRTRPVSTHATGSRQLSSSRCILPS